MTRQESTSEPEFGCPWEYFAPCQTCGAHTGEPCRNLTAAKRQPNGHVVNKDPHRGRPQVEFVVRDAETLLSEVQDGCNLLGLPPFPPEVELQMTEALDYFAEQAANRYRAVPPFRGAAIALLRGIAAALNEDDLGETFRWPTRAQVTWWERGYYGLHKITRYRFRRWTCTFCGHRVGGSGPEHGEGCKQWRAKRGAP